MPDLNTAIRKQLAEIDASMGCTGSLWGADEMQAALFAVLDLHTCHPDHGQGYGPDDDPTEGAYGYMGSVCTTCGTPGEYAIRWPCPTVLAIAKELGIEVSQ